MNGWRGGALWVGRLMMVVSCIPLSFSRCLGVSVSGFFMCMFVSCLAVSLSCRFFWEDSMLFARTSSQHRFEMYLPGQLTTHPRSSSLSLFPQRDLQTKTR
ncbi:hypothetical protein DFS34DRAFT_480796 [Phlyctochytrium arcticum]|nr:hypothetical protein DFS34DRAFT_480796 [Phlyctochytrium arcticum]